MRVKDLASNKLSMKESSPTQKSCGVLRWKTSSIALKLQNQHGVDYYSSKYTLLSRIEYWVDIGHHVVLPLDYVFVS